MKKIFTWDSNHSVENEEIDKQHQIFFDLCNQLIELSEKNTINKEEALLLIDKLGNYAFYHFGMEEELFEKTEYPKIDEHIQKHNAFRKQFNNLSANIYHTDSVQKEDIYKIAQFAGEWIEKHILSVDKEFTQYL
jgi:hemerythrin-like metal-binding protein